jgi:hypothetical protein
MNNLCGKKFFKIHEFEIKRKYLKKISTYIYNNVTSINFSFLLLTITIYCPFLKKMNVAHLVRKKERKKPLVHNNVLVVLNM